MDRTEIIASEVRFSIFKFFNPEECTFLTFFPIPFLISGQHLQEKRHNPQEHHVVEEHETVDRCRLCIAFGGSCHHSISVRYQLRQLQALRNSCGSFTSLRNFQTHIVGYSKYFLFISLLYIRFLLDLKRSVLLLTWRVASDRSSEACHPEKLHGTRSCHC